MHRIAVDRTRRLCDEPHTGHNRYHPDIAPILEVEDGAAVEFETRDAIDGQLGPGSTEADFAAMDVGAIHPLTGPVFVKGAVPGDALEVEFLEIAPADRGFSAILPGLGFLRDLFETPFLVHWDLADGWATSPQIPGVRIPGAPFMGISATAPSAEALAAWDGRERRLAGRGGVAHLPSADGAVPAGCGLSGLRTNPPRENGGNFDVKQLTVGARLVLPVFVEGALFSTGDGHFAQGDGEVSVTAVEMAATVAARFRLLKGLAARRRLTAPVFSHPGYRPATADGRGAEPVIGAMGYPLDAAGENDGENVTLAARNALLNMIALLEERGFSREQAYVICSVACDLRISNIVDLPNVTVSAMLPETIFG
jgi:formamidase